MILPDTTPQAHRVQIETWRRLGPHGRLQQALELMRVADQLLAAGVRGRHPEYTDEQVRLAVIRLKLPRELFEA